MKFKYILFFFLSVLVFSACSTLKSYERIYVNDPEMQMGNNVNQNFESYVHAVREGAMPAGGSKGSGGCGCN